MCYARHPSLQEYPDYVKEPTQGGKTSLDAYLQRWVHHVQRQALQGYFYCDRYFYQRFYRNMHLMFRENLGREIFIWDLAKNCRV